MTLLSLCILSFPFIQQKVKGTSCFKKDGYYQVGEELILYLLSRTRVYQIRFISGPVAYWVEVYGRGVTIIYDSATQAIQ